MGDTPSPLSQSRTNVLGCRIFSFTVLPLPTLSSQKIITVPYTVTSPSCEDYYCKWSNDDDKKSLILL